MENAREFSVSERWRIEKMGFELREVGRDAAALDTLGLRRGDQDLKQRADFSGVIGEEFYGGIFAEIDFHRFSLSAVVRVPF